MRRFAVLLGALAVTLVTALVSLGTHSAMAATSPSATTNAATGVATTGATLNASVNLQGGTLDGTQAALSTVGADSTGCYFEYGTTSGTYTSYASCAPTPASTADAQAVAAALTGLSPGTTYYDNVVIVIQNNSISLVGGLLPGTYTSYSGTEQSFTTPTATVTPTVATAAAANVGGTSATLHATVNPENYSISSCQFTYTPSGGTPTTVACAGTPSGAGSQNVSADVSGLSQGTAYSYGVAVGYSGATVTSSSSSAFTTLSASIGTPSGLTATTATLNATVNPQGQTITACTFYSGTSGPTLVTTPCSTAASQITGTSNLSVSAALTGLTQGTAYLQTVVLTTSSGAMVTATPSAFTTLAEPKATTTAATAVTGTTATLHATVNAGGEGVRACGFEFAVNRLTSSTTGNDLALVEPCASTPAATGDQATSVTLKGLAPGTTYYFRVIVTTDGGYAIANTESFRTRAASARPTIRIARATVDRKARSAKFTFARTGRTLVTRGFQCSLVTVTKGKAGAAHYATCRSGRTYRKLKATTYVFSVRGRDAAGDSAVRTHRFTI